MERWLEVVKVLTAQHGVVSNHQLAEMGITRNVIERWVEHHRLERASPGVLRVAGAPVTWEQRLMHGLLSLGPAAGVSHRSAAYLHRLDRSTPDHVEFLVGRSHRSPRLDEIVHSSKLIRQHDFVTINGFRSTSATRTILDLANLGVHPDVVKASIDSAIRLQLSAPEVIRRRLFDIRRRGRGGVRLIDELLIDSGGHSMLEREFLRLMREAGLPRPTPQVVYREGKRTMARVDFLFHEWDIVVEVSGRLGHSSPTERARDAQRRNELQDIGLRVYEFTWEQVTRRPYWVQQQMRQRLWAAGWAA